MTTIIPTVTVPISTSPWPGVSGVTISTFPDHILIIDRGIPTVSVSGTPGQLAQILTMITQIDGPSEVPLNSEPAHLAKSLRGAA